MHIRIIILILLLTAFETRSQTTAFSYQGSLNDSGNPANGSFQMRFRLFDALSGGTQIGTTLNDIPVTAASGVFSTKLDFGANALSGANRWLEISVRRNAGESYVTLSPREQIASAPYSVRTLSAASADVATNALNLGGAPAAQFVQTTDARLSDARNPLPGSASYIQNGSGLQPSSSFNISGNGFVGGNLGIGTTTPAFRLDVVGTFRATRSVSNDVVVQTTGGTNSWARFWAMTPNRAWVLGTSQNFNGDQFYVNDETMGQSRLTIQPNGGPIVFPAGNIGVGASPGLLNGASGRFISISDPNSPGLALTHTGTGGNQYFLYSSATGTGTGKFSIFDATHNAERFFISENGNTGTSGNAIQPSDKSGWVKAMVVLQEFINPGQIVRCYNGVTGSSVVPCGFAVTRVGPGSYRINFGFSTEHRFSAVTTRSQCTVGAGYAPVDGFFWVQTSLSGQPTDCQPSIIIY